MGLTNAVFGSSKYLFFSMTFDIMLEKSESIIFESNLITFRGIKSGPVAFLAFLSLKPSFTIEATTQDKKRRVRCLLMREKAPSRVRRLLMMGKASKRVGAQVGEL